MQSLHRCQQGLLVGPASRAGGLEHLQLLAGAAALALQPLHLTLQGLHQAHDLVWRSEHFALIIFLHSACNAQVPEAVAASSCTPNT